MGKIVREAKQYVNWYLPDIQQTGMANDFLRPFRTIESEIGQLYEMLAQRTKRIEELEKRVPDYTKWHDVDKFYPPNTPEPKSTVKEKINADKDGKPPGGLEPGDIFDYNSLVYNKRMDAIFIQQTPHQKTNGWIEGRRISDGDTIIIGDGYNWKFKFRPPFPDRKER